jgi:hypothetical protein
MILGFPFWEPKEGGPKDGIIQQTLSHRLSMLEGALTLLCSVTLFDCLQQWEAYLLSCGKCRL